MDTINLLLKRFKNIHFVFHSTNEKIDFIKNYINQNNKNNHIDIISDESIKNQILAKSIFAISKSGTISLEICNYKIHSIIIYKLKFINYVFIKSLIKVKFANIINIIVTEK